MTVIPITYGYARVRKADDNSKNLETQLRELDAHGIRRDLAFTDEASGRTMDRLGWRDLMSRVQPGDTVVVAFLDRFSLADGGTSSGNRPGVRRPGMGCVRVKYI